MNASNAVWTQAEVLDWSGNRIELRGFTAAHFHGRDCRLYTVQGPRNGPTLLLIPGLNDSWTSFEQTLLPLSETHHVVAVDLRGHGYSDAGSGQFRVIDYASDLEDLIVRGLRSNVRICGASLGGLIAVRLAATLTERVDAIVCVDAPFLITEWPRWRDEPSRENIFGDVEPLLADIEAQRSTLADVQPALRRRRWAVVPPDYPGRVRHLEKLMRLLSPAWPGLSADARGRLETGHARFLRGERSSWSEMIPERMIADSAKKYARLTHACVATAVGPAFNAGWSHRDALRAISCPALIVEADRDLVGMLRPEDITLVLSCLRQAEHVVVDGALHEVHETHAALFVDLVSRFFAGEHRKDSSR